MQVRSSSPDETHALAAQLAEQSVEGTIYALVGSLGSGKTEFVRGFVTALSPDAAVRSPSFTLVNTFHTAKFVIHHFDFYRLNTPDELLEIGFHEYINDDAVCLIEWADMFPEVIPDKSLYIRFEEEKGNVRIISIEK